MLNYIRTVYTHLNTSQEHIYVSWISFFFSFHASLPNLTLTILTLRTTSKFLICSLVALWNFLPFLWEFYCYLLLSLLLSFFSLFLCCRSVVRLYPTLWNPVNCSTPDFPISHHLLELAQTCVHWVGDTIQPSCPLSSLSAFPRIRIFSNESVLRIRCQSIGASASVIPMNTQDWSPLGWTGWISLLSKGLSRVFSNTIVKSINSLVLSHLYGPTLTSIND